MLRVASTSSQKQARPCKSIANGNYDSRCSLSEGAKRRWGIVLCGRGLATVVLTITTYFHHMRFLGLFAVFAAILTALFGWAITSGMRTF